MFITCVGILSCKNEIQIVPLYECFDLTLTVDSLVKVLTTWQEPIREIEVLVVVEEGENRRIRQSHHNHGYDELLNDGIDGDSESEDLSIPPSSGNVGGNTGTTTTTTAGVMNYMVSGKLHTRYTLSTSQRQVLLGNRENKNTISLSSGTPSSSTTIDLSPNGFPRLVSHDLQVYFLKSGQYHVQAFVKIHYDDPHYGEDDFGGATNIWWTNETDISILAVDE